MASSTPTPAGPDYYAAMQKNLVPSPNMPLNKGPYLDQAGQMPIQSVMSPTDFQGSMGPNWEEFSKPGGYLDKFYQGQTQILGENQQPMTIEQMTKALQAGGKTFTPNPYLAIPTLQGQLYQNLDKNVGNYYQQLQDQLNQGRQEFGQRTANYGQKIGGYFDQAGADVQGFGQGRVNANQDFANSIGLGGTTGAGTQTANLQDQLARLGAINAVNKGNAQATFDQRRGIIEDLLQQRALSSATTGAQTRDAIAEMAAQHWGLADPNQLYSDYLTQLSNVDVLKSQNEIKKLELQQALAELQAGAAGGGGGGSGGGGGGGGSSGGASTGGFDMRQTLQQLADSQAQVEPWLGTPYELPPGVDLVTGAATNPRTPVASAVGRRVTRGKAQAV